MWQAILSVSCHDKLVWRWSAESYEGVCSWYRASWGRLRIKRRSWYGDLTCCRAPQQTNLHHQAASPELLWLSCPRLARACLFEYFCSFCLRHVCTVVCAMTAKALGQGKQECLYLSGGLAKFAPMPRHQGALASETIMNNCGWLPCKQFWQDNFIHSSRTLLVPTTLKQHRQQQPQSATFWQVYILQYSFSLVQNASIVCVTPAIRHSFSNCSLFSPLVRKSAIISLVLQYLSSILPLLTCSWIKWYLTH